MADLLSRLSRSGITLSCVAHGRVSWGSKDNDAAELLHLWYDERDSIYYLYTSNTAGHYLVCKVIDVFSLLPKVH